jgi:hypothetical protein
MKRHTPGLAMPPIILATWFAAACEVARSPLAPEPVEPTPARAEAASVPLAATEAADLLPDNGFARLSDVSIEKAHQGRRILRFSTTIVNVGSGPFELYGRRDTDTDTEMTVVQRIQDADGGWREVSTTAVMEHGGDGHAHWHVHDLVDATVYNLDNGAAVARSTKIGFCFFDNTEYKLGLPGAPQSIVYEEPGCGREASLEATMGLSVGWGDIYPSYLPGQHIDISHLRSGRYRLLLTVDPFGWFTESNRSNNTTWVDIEVRGNGNSIRVVGYGPSA